MNILDELSRMSCYMVDKKGTNSIGMRREGWTKVKTPAGEVVWASQKYLKEHPSLRRVH